MWMVREQPQQRHGRLAGHGGTCAGQGPGAPEAGEEQSQQAAGPSLPFPTLSFLPRASSWGPLGPLKGLTREQRGLTWSIERSYQLPDGPQEGRPAQRDQMAAAAVSRREGEAGRGHGRPWGWRQGVREAEQWAGERRQGMEDCSGDRADVGEVEEEE